MGFYYLHGCGGLDEDVGKRLELIEQAIERGAVQMLPLPGSEKIRLSMVEEAVLDYRRGAMGGATTGDCLATLLTFYKGNLITKD